jgi:hypothetical protein
LLSIASHGFKIPKPDGEAGRPNRGGYNLESALKWDTNRFKTFKVRSHLSDEILLEINDIRSAFTLLSRNIVTLARARHPKPPPR